METRLESTNTLSSTSATGLIKTKTLPQTEKVEVLEWPPDRVMTSSRPSAEATPRIKAKRLVFSIKRPDGSELLSVYKYID